VAGLTRALPAKVHSGFAVRQREAKQARRREVKQARRREAKQRSSVGRDQGAKSAPALMRRPRGAVSVCELARAK